MKGAISMNTKDNNVELDERAVISDGNTGESMESQNESAFNDELKGAIQETMSKIQRQNLLLGAQAMCQTILDKIVAFERKPGSKSNNDHKRLIKDIKRFCEIGLSRKVNVDGETEPVEGTAQN